MTRCTDVFEDIKWIDKNYISLQRKFPHKYIVVKNYKVVVVADDYDTADTRATEVLGSDIEFTVERIEIGELFAY